MSLPPLPLIDGCLFVDNSGFMEGCSSCYRYLQYKCLNLRIPSAEKPALNFGSVQHLARELRYLHYLSGATDEQYLNDLIPLFTDFFTQHPPQVDDWRTLNWAVEMTKRYEERYRVEDFSLLNYDESINCPYCNGLGYETFLDSNTGIEAKSTCIWCKGTGKRSLMVELTFALPLFTYTPQRGSGSNFLATGETNDIPVIYTGRIDLPLSIDGQIWVMDHKHVGMLGQSFWDEQRMTAQHRGYVWAFQQLTKIPVKGYLVNACRTKAPPQYVTSGQSKGKKLSPESWWAESFQRERFLCEPWKIEEWKNNTIDLVEEFFWHYSKGFMPQKTKWCSQYGRCPYYDICTIAPEDRGVLLNSGQYTDNIWSPLKQPTQPMQ